MAEARDKAAWNQIFATMAAIRNTVVDKEKDLIDPMDFYPWTVAEKVDAPPPTPAQDAALSEAFPLTSKGR